MGLLKDQLKKNDDVLVLSYDDRNNGGHNLMEKFGFLDRLQDLGQMMMSSEGERIHIGLSDFVNGMRKAIWQREPDELWIFMDAVGSGLSIDGIREIKDFASAIIEDNAPKRKVYFIVSTNEYEFTTAESEFPLKVDCLDVTTFKHLSFKDYEDYRQFVLHTRKKKDKRVK
jgi:hypothetical protein